MPSIVPSIDSEDIHLVLNNFGDAGMAYVETDPLHADRTTIVRMLAEGQFSNPVRVICVNVGKGIVTDVSEDVAMAVMQGGRVAEETADFVRFHLGLMREGVDR